MKRNTSVTVLGGGQSIGAACFYVSINGKKILLDCGMVKNSKICKKPDFRALQQSGEKLDDISCICISHAHSDHIGFLPYVFEECGRPFPTFASHLTKELGEILLYDHNNIFDSNANSNEQLDYTVRFSQAFRAITPLDFASTKDFSDFRLTFYMAGHIPGAAMIFIESDAGSILYTGDFSYAVTPLTHGVGLPNGLKADTVIIDGTLAKRPNYTNSHISDASYESLKYIKYTPIYIQVNQLTKGIETLCRINELMEINAIPRTRVYIDGTIMDMAVKLGANGISILNPNCFLYDKSIVSNEKAIYIGSRPSLPGTQKVVFDYSLHANFNDLCRFISNHAKKNVLVVHSPETDEPANMYALARYFDLDERLNIIYPETGETYFVS